MHQTVILQLCPSPEQAKALAGTILAINQAANHAARVGFKYDCFERIPLHQLCYYKLRQLFGLRANHACRAIDKATGAFARDQTVCPEFALDGAVPLDDQLYGIPGDCVSVATVDGRIKMPFQVAPCHQRLLTGRRKQADLVRRDGIFYLHVTIEVEEPPAIQPVTVLGVDLGIVQIATTSEGQAFSGADIEAVRKRRSRARRTYQKRNTRNSKRRLKKMARKQHRFQTATNHRISKQIVARAQALGAGIALEDLTGIRGRTERTVSRPVRIRIGNWSFAQLGKFIVYKAALAGVPVAFVDPRNTSRTCSQCGYCDRRNRKSQADFRCCQCGFSLNADQNGARCIAQKAVIGFLGAPCSQP